MHVNEGRLQTYADGELPDAENAEVELHLGVCVACRAESARLRDLSNDFSEAMDRLVPAVQNAVFAPADTRRAPSAERLRRALPRAAVFLIGVAAAASATVPGSPVRDWLARAITPPPRVAPVAAHPAPVAAPAAAPEAGVSVDPLNGAVRVTLRGARDDLLVRAEIVEGPRAGVYATGEAVSARFRTAPGSIEVDGIGEGELRVELPRAALSATVSVNGREYLRKEGDQLRLSMPAAGRSATAVTFRIKQ